MDEGRTWYGNFHRIGIITDLWNGILGGYYANPGSCLLYTSFPMLTWTAIEQGGNEEQGGKEALKLRLFVDKSSAVSYTHLDVYKRQTVKFIFQQLRYWR